jgi:hypothetical protein
MRGLCLAANLIATSGCGTMANLEGKSLPMISHVQVEEPRPFGGVGRDIRWISTMTPPANLMFVGDLPLSLVGDVVTLPRTLRNKPARLESPQALDRSQPDMDSQR